MVPCYCYCRFCALGFLELLKFPCMEEEGNSFCVGDEGNNLLLVLCSYCDSKIIIIVFISYCQERICESFYVL